MYLAQIKVLLNSGDILRETGAPFHWSSEPREGLAVYRAFSLMWPASMQIY